jgi:pimeloyl-ACP methyl ester carboxylesterase
VSNSVDVLSPEAELAEIESRACRLETPCGDGMMVWRMWGEGELLVLGHGGQGAWSHWVRNIDALAAHYTVIVPDLPGHGDSAMPATVDHDTISAIVGEGLQALPGVGGPVLFAGFSFGGAVFVHLAVRYPELVEKVVIIGTGGLDTPHGHIDLGRVGGLHGEERRAAIKRNLLGLMLHNPDSVDEMARHLLVTNARQARLPVTDLVLPDKVLEVLPRLTVPLGAIWGDSDRPHPGPALQEGVLRRFQPDCDFRVIADAGHWAMYEQPEAFNAALLDILNQPTRQVSRLLGSSIG